MRDVPSDTDTRTAATSLLHRGTKMHTLSPNVHTLCSVSPLLSTRFATSPRLDRVVRDLLNQFLGCVTRFGGIPSETGSLSQIQLRNVNLQHTFELSNAVTQVVVALAMSAK